MEIKILNNYLKENVTYQNYLQTGKYENKVEEDEVIFCKNLHRFIEEYKFLVKRDNKLQQIEMMYKNKNIDLDELRQLVKKQVK